VGQGASALFGFLPPSWLIFVVGIILAGGIFAIGVWAWTIGEREHASRLVTGAMVAFAVLVVQLMIEARAHHEGQLRQQQADREGLLLLLGRQNDLSGVDLRKKDLAGSYLNGKILNDADLSDAVLGTARLVDAKLVSADLRGADLQFADLDGSDLRQADLSGAKLKGASLRGAKLDAATLGRRRVKGKLVPADLTGAHLQHAFLSADLQYANLTGANLEGAHLAPANLSHAMLAGANFWHADLRGAILSDVDLRKTRHLDDPLDLSYAVYNRNTHWPAGLEWPGLRKTCPGVCQLGEKPIARFPPKMRALEARLQKLTDELHCPPGWHTDPSNPFVLRVVSARGIAEFQITARDVGRTTPGQWASYDKAKSDVHPLPDVNARLGSTYAERYSRGSASSPREEVAVYQVIKGQGFRYATSASAALFPLFERDFSTLFLGVGIHGTLFHELAGERSAGCNG
jgi:uncharacterized protein YjbI with pentapeptide repeats